MFDGLELSEDFSLWSLFLSAFLSSTLLPGSSEALLVLYLGHGINPLSLLVVATVGNTLGGASSWLIGYWLVHRYPNSVPKKIDQQALYRIRHWGWPVLLLSWVPVIGDPLCVAAGWLKIHWLPSLLAIAAGKLARYSVMVWLLA